LQLSQTATQADLPAGAHLEPLKSIAEREGLPASFAGPWSVPSTSTINATPDRQPHVLPPMLPNSGIVPPVPVPPDFAPAPKSPAAAPAGSTAPKQ
ncbi:MAG: cytochrome c, partial [Edaphobacter sp.]